MYKKVYICVSLLYLLIFLIFIFKYPISYRIVGVVNPEIIKKERNFTFDEFQSLEYAETIRFEIYNLFLYSSILFSLISFCLWKWEFVKPALYTKIGFFFGLLWAIILILISGINFYPVL